MRLLRNLSLIVFLVGFIHASILVGGVYTIPVVGQVFKSYLANSGDPWKSIPMQVYGRVGTEIWGYEPVAGLLKEHYGPLTTRAGRHLNPKTNSVGFDLDLANYVVLGALGGFILFGLLAPRR